MRRAIIDFHTDEEDHWVADLECGHTQHVRHRPRGSSGNGSPTPEGRASMLGYRLWYKRCEDGEPPSRTPEPPTQL
ncbi:DUF3565 domain-containing protein [Aquisalimonas sp.]|uniref:DUF3565 domain-containing protein n=1 Tax=Aquisalimonas sp. TaxID=1872621 RepID=UPI0025BC1A10|nr:DUF3565 domain-containing protein [Aquisalimonas sp.]